VTVVSLYTLQLHQTIELTKYVIDGNFWKVVCNVSEFEFNKQLERDMRIAMQAKATKEDNERMTLKRYNRERMLYDEDWLYRRSSR
jgi:hypothetical protein